MSTADPWAPEPPQPTAPPRPRRCTGAFRCFSGRSRSSIQGLLSAHYPRLWDEVAAKWLPSARPIEPGHLQANGDYSRATLAEVLTGLGESAREWDGFEVCDTLKHFYGWQADFHLAAIIHAWSRDLSHRLRTP
jgi:hypothetical protein